MKRIVFFVFVLGLNYVLCSQNVGISSTPFTPDVSAGLDIQFSDKGLLIPRVALTNINDASTIALPAISLLVYCDGTAGLPAGYYYNTGTPATPNWTLLLSNNNVNNEVWMLEGNSGTNIATNFIGTTDNKPLYFRVNNVKAGYIGISSDNSVFLGYEAGLNDNGTNNQNAFIGSGAGRANTSGDFNTAGGYHALYCNTTGSGNTALGHRALRFNIDGFENTAVGYCTLDSNSTGVGNTVTGCYAAMSNKSGSWNSVSGYAALHDNTSGSQNSAFGFHALFSNTSGSQNTAIGLGTLSSNRAGNLATAVGHYAMFYSNSDSVPFQNHNVAVGAYSLRGSIIPADNTGNYNTIMGYEAAFHNASGDANTANGYMSLYYNSTGY